MRRGERGGIFFRLLSLLSFLAFRAFLYSVRNPLMRLAGNLWMVNDPVVSTDVIIVLGDDNYAGDRAFHAAELYRSGLAPVVVASGRMLRANTGIADLMEHDLESFGIPAASIVKFAHRGANTQEEASALAWLIATRKWKRVLLVTSNYHARRARFILEQFVPPAVTVQVSGGRDSDFEPSRWWETRQGQKLFLGELFGYALARWELRNKSNAPASAVVLALGFSKARWARTNLLAAVQYQGQYRIGNRSSLQVEHPIL
jgi:uncharacterized SAM-binding protein YcdF (DUF218 family)